MAHKIGQREPGPPASRDWAAATPGSLRRAGLNRIEREVGMDTNSE